LGFVKGTQNPQLLGWILVRKRLPDERYVALLAPGEETEYVSEQDLLRKRPYQVRIVELDRDVFDSDRYETEGDFHLNECRYFSSLDDVEEFVFQFGYLLKDIKWPIEIDAP